MLKRTIPFAVLAIVGIFLLSLLASKEVLAEGNISRLQSKSGSVKPGSSVVISLDNSTVSGNTLILSVSNYYTGVNAGLPWTISDNKGNTWHEAANFSNGATIKVYYAENIIGGSGHSITITSSPASYFVATAVEYSGLATSSAFDVSATNRATSANYVSNATTTTQADELLFGVHHVYNIGATFTPSSLWDTVAVRSDGTYHQHQIQDRVATSSGSFTSTGSLSSSLDTQSVLVTFKASTSGTSTPPSDTTAPVLSNIQSSSITSSTTVISWTTDEVSDGEVEYGTTTAYGFSSDINSSLITNHSVQLSGLSENTLYHYRVKSKDAATNLAISDDYTFTTFASSTSTTSATSVSWTKMNQTSGWPGANGYLTIHFDPVSGQTFFYVLGGIFNGTVSVTNASSTVHLVSGDQFSPNWALAAGDTMMINGVARTLGSIQSGNELTLAADYPGATGTFSYSVAPTTIYSTDVYFYNSATNSFTHVGGNGTITNASANLVTNTTTWPRDRHPVAQMALDTKRNVLWLRGGVIGGLSLNDMYYMTLHADPLQNTWTQVNPAHHPMDGSSLQAMVYDPENDVLFEWGYDGGAGNHNHWVYCPTDLNLTPGVLTSKQSSAGCTNPDDWSEVTPVGDVQPPGSAFPLMVFDSLTNKIIQFGGSNNLGPQNETWAYDVPTKTWTQKCSGGCIAPPPTGDASNISQPAMIYNSITHKILYHQTNNAGAPADWEYDTIADTWTKLTSIGGGSAVPTVLAFDSASNKLIGWTGGYNGDLWQGALGSTTIISDTEAPSTPSNLSATSTSSSQINLSWDASTDNIGVMGYRIFRNGNQIATSTQIVFTDVNLAASTTYSYTVSAYDAAGNISDHSSPVSAITLDGSVSTVITREQYKSGSIKYGKDVTVAFDNPTISGNQLIVAVSDYYATASSDNSISDSKGNTWNVAVNYANGARTKIYYAENIVGGVDHQVTVSTPSNAYFIVTAVEYSGLATTSSLNATSTNRDTSINYTSNSATTDSPNELLFGLHHVWNIAATFNPDNSWTTIERKTDGTYHEQQIQDKVVNSIGSHASTGTISSSLDTVSAMATFRGE